MTSGYFDQSSSSSLTPFWYPQTITTSGTVYAPYFTSVALPSVADAPAELGDREWLDAQVAEVCELAVAA